MLKNAEIDQKENFLIEDASKAQDKPEWTFKPVEVKKGISEGGWVEIKLLEPLAEKTLVVWNNAYYLIAEMKKAEVEHGH